MITSQASIVNLRRYKFEKCVLKGGMTSLENRNLSRRVIKTFCRILRKLYRKKTNRGKGNLFSFQCPIPNETNMIVKTFWMPYIIQRKAFLDRFKSKFKKCHCVQFSTIGFADIQISLLLISNLTNLSNSFFIQFVKFAQNVWISIQPEEI